MIGIGYEGRSLDELIKTLREEGVAMLVDVRLNAISRKKGFSKRALSEGLDAAGIQYVHMPELGNPKDNRSGFAETDSAEGDAARRRFEALLEHDQASAALRGLAELAGLQKVAVFCYERSEDHCHRHQVLTAARALLNDSVPV